MKAAPARLLLKLLYLLLTLALLAAFFTEGKVKAAVMLSMGILLLITGVAQILIALFIRKD